MDPQHRVLEEGKRLSQSLLYTLQRRYFEAAGIEAWRTGTVPHYVTSNPVMANAYARLVLSFLADGERSGTLDIQAPVYLLELGAGSGRFAFSFLHHFQALYKQSGLNVPLVYVMSDLPEVNIAFWRQHPALMPFVTKGQLDFAQLDLEHPAAVTLLESGRQLEPGQASNPLIVVASYVFDGLPTDRFEVDSGGDLWEGLATLRTPQATTDPLDPALIQDIEVDFTFAPTLVPYYHDRLLDGALVATQAAASSAWWFPVGALQACEQLVLLGGGRLLLVAADRSGDATARSGAVARHGSFSLDVNFDAVGAWFRQQGGEALRTGHQAAHLEVAAFTLGLSAANLSGLRAAFTERVARFGPDDYFAVKHAFDDRLDTLDLPTILALLRLADADPRLLGQCQPRLHALAAAADERQRRDLCNLAQEAWQLYYHLGEPTDFAFDLGVLLFELGFPVEACDMFRHSLTLYGPDPSTLFNLALCYEQIGDEDATREHVVATLQADPSHKPAQALRAQLGERPSPAG
jgi:hypothetical protein